MAKFKNKITEEIVDIKPCKEGGNFYYQWKRADGLEDSRTLTPKELANEFEQLKEERN